MANRRKSSPDEAKRRAEILLRYMERSHFRKDYEEWWSKSRYCYFESTFRETAITSLIGSKYDKMEELLDDESFLREVYDEIFRIDLMFATKGQRQCFWCSIKQMRERALRDLEVKKPRSRWWRGII